MLNCELYLKYSKSKCKQPLSMSLGQKIWLNPWTNLATDIFHFEGVSYLLLVDYTSRFPEVCKLNPMTAQHVAGHFKLIFSEYGWPDTLVSDIGPCYSVEIFTNLMQEYGVNHITSSPHYPQSNSLTERFVQIIKNLFHKVEEEGTDIFKSLMIYYNIPLSSTTQSPMQMLQNTTARSQLAMSHAARKQLGLSSEHLRVKNKNAHLPSHDLCVGQDVMFQDSISKRWFPATITSLCEEPRSYKIATKDCFIYRKCKHI